MVFSQCFSCRHESTIVIHTDTNTPAASRHRPRLKHPTIPEDRRYPPASSQCTRPTRPTRGRKRSTLGTARRRPTGRRICFFGGPEQQKAVVEGDVIAHVLHRVLYPQVHANGVFFRKKKTILIDLVYETTCSISRNADKTRGKTSNEKGASSFTLARYSA